MATDEFFGKNQKSKGEKIRPKNQTHRKENIVLIIGVALLAICWIGTEIRYQKYEAYAKKHNCEWRIINEKEICK